ncbi:hypothetical protein PoB_000109800 [Plakobranchus ocellatus]|uniref:Uncharacterized protein n=1 Tax=Plakobranchus ocellatus TaxID=259542 RepID=A0AAV3XWE4_9GAST|nr:hypothetical protein PoB_000109800 [Plakobranchus ocellatus]
MIKSETSWAINNNNNNNNTNNNNNSISISNNNGNNNSNNNNNNNNSRPCFRPFYPGVGGTVANESALRPAWTLLSRVRAPPPTPWPS